MNIGEANAWNTVLRFLLSGNHDGGDSQRAREAAILLSDKAHKALLAGHDGTRTAAAWQHNRVDWGEAEVDYLLDEGAQEWDDDDPIPLVPLNDTGREALG